MIGVCPGCGAERVELNSIYKERKFEVPLCWCCRMRRHNQINEGFDPFACAPDAETREMITAFAAMAERQIEREAKRAARRAPRPFRLPGECWASHSCPVEK